MTAAGCVGGGRAAVGRRGNGGMGQGARRRILVNDDGSVAAVQEAADIERSLAARFKPSVNTQVDTYFLCVGGSDPGPDQELGTRLWHTQSCWFPDLKAPPATDVTTRAHIDACRAAGMEIFASFRLNDQHDAGEPQLVYPLKVARPDLLLGSRATSPGNALMSASWSGFDYAHAEVRDHFFTFITSYCAQYDFDGAELDLLRSPLFFRLGEAEAHIDVMTELVRRVRRALTETGRGRGRPYLLAARVPDTPLLARRIGLDVESWLAGGLLDLLIVGRGNTQLSAPYEEFIRLGHRYGIPVYPCINFYLTAEHMRASAANMHAAGADGVYLFNYSPLAASEPPPWWRILRGADPWPGVRIEDWGHELGTPESLLYKDKLYQLETGH